MKQFGYRYLALLPLLFALFYWEHSPVAESINHYQTKLTLYFLNFGLREGQLRGIDIMINPHYKIIVTKACNGMIPILVLFSAILAYPSEWPYKARWILAVYVILAAANVFRLLMVAHYVKKQTDFSLYHDLFGNLLLVLTGLALLYLFLRRARLYRLRR